jgi:excisionase family DNA binding protein
MNLQAGNRLTFDRKEAARKLGVSVVTVDRELAKKRLPHLRIGRRVLFTDEILQTYIAKNTKNG